MTDEKTLNVLLGSKRYGPLSRREVEDLVLEGRIDDNGLICALRGPWMRIEDFFSAPPPPRKVNLRRQRRRPLRRSQGEEILEAEPVLDAEVIAWEELPQVPRPKREGRVVEAELIGIESTIHEGSGVDPGTLLFADWQVMINGVPTHRLTLTNIKELLAAGEITRYNAARHSSWRADAWKPIHTIPMLAEVLR